MKLSELMAGITPSTDYAGISTNDDFVLAVDIAATASESEGDYIVVQAGIAAVDAQISAESDEKTYIRQGKVTTKTAVQRTFNLTGDRILGDAFQDFAFSHETKFGTGQKVVKPYVYFSALTGKGEKGNAAIIVNSDGSGDAGASAEVDVDIMATGTPTEYTWTTT